MNLLKTIKDTKKHIRDLKKTNPHLFTEYIDVLHAQSELEKAKLVLHSAKAKWKKVGN
jgi:hypothetical protein